MTLLRIRDPKSTENLEQSKKKIESKPKRSKRRHASTDTSKAGLKPHSQTEEKVDNTAFIDTSAEQENNKHRYVLSFTSNSDVTFTNTICVCSSVIFRPQRETTDNKINDFQPLDLSLSSAGEQVISTSTFDVKAAEDASHHKDFSNNTLRIPILVSEPLTEGDRAYSNWCSFANVASGERDVFVEGGSAMLSSRRHTSDDSYKDRDHFALNDGKSTYPNSAKAWLHARGSPEQANMNGFVEAPENTGEPFESNSESSYQSKEELFDKADDPNEVEQEDAFNYSVKNRASDEDSNGAENCPETNLLKAKKARVENIVTSIKDKPNKSMPNDFTDSDQHVTIQPKNLSLNMQNSRKRKMNEKIQELQREIASLQRECENEGDCLDLSSNDEDIPHESKDWNHQNKRPRIRNEGSSPQYQEADRLPESCNGFYRGSLNVAVPQNGRRPGTSDSFSPASAYDVLVQSLKRELTSALERVAEESARRVLEELRSASANNEKISLTRDTEEIDKEDLQNLPMKIDRNENKEKENLPSSEKPYKNTSSFLANGDMEGLQTSDQSQLRDQDSRNRESPNGRNVFWDRESRGDRKRRESYSERVGNRTEDNKVQTHALSLVKKDKRSSSFSHKSSTSRDDTPPFVQINKEGFSSNLHDSSQKLLLDSPKSPLSSAPIDSTSRSDRSPPPSLYGKPRVPQSIFPENNLHPSASSSAFRFPVRHETLASPPFRRDFFVPASVMKTSPIFGPTIYSSAAPSQSIFPFTSGPLSFPLFQNLQQRSLANAIADYGGFGERFYPGSNRPTSTRTSTREPSRSAGLSRSQQQGGKTESLDYRSAGDVSPYSAASIQEGLTPQHLKKAKLMFFYTRYPSANTLKTYFADVKFSRATTSQLIKWFSNFREFYYIQMEKFARQALGEGVTDICQIHVTRDSELFRVLNLHYNKSNDFKVPNEFLTATMKSLQEFFLAIQSNNDRDPSWKKVIYKVICKLDQDIPDLFKSPSVLDHLDEIVN